MTRLSYVLPGAMTDAQREMYDSIANGPRAKAAKSRSLVSEEGGLYGPFNAWLHAPEVGRHWAALGESLRFRTNLDRRLFEIAVLVVAQHWRSGHEWVAHSVLARDAGVSPEVIEAITKGELPVFVRDDEAAVFEFASELVRQGRAGTKAYDKAQALLGETQLAELVLTISYYAALALSMNAFAVEPPSGFDHPWKTPL